jgi:hypothetical protein
MKPRAVSRSRCWLVAVQAFALNSSKPAAHPLRRFDFSLHQAGGHQGAHPHSALGYWPAGLFRERRAVN